MTKLSVTAPRAQLMPAVTLHQLDQFLDFQSSAPWLVAWLSVSRQAARHGDMIPSILIQDQQLVTKRNRIAVQTTVSVPMILIVPICLLSSL